MQQESKEPDIIGTRKTTNYMVPYHLISDEDYCKIYDMTINKGTDYQAQIPYYGSSNNKDMHTFKIYGYTNRQFQGNNYGTLGYEKDNEEVLIVKVPKRSIGEYIEWDPLQCNNEFKVLCHRVIQYIRQNYNIEFKEYDILEYYRICRMNKGIFLNSIHGDYSPFLEFVRNKRAKLKN